MTPVENNINNHLRKPSLAAKKPQASVKHNKDIKIDFGGGQKDATPPKKTLDKKTETPAASAEKPSFFTRVKNWFKSIWKSFVGFFKKPTPVPVKPAVIVVKTQQDVVKKTGLRKEFLDKLEFYEGKHNKMYIDGAGKKTIGIGHNVSADKKYKYGKKISDQQTYSLLADDLLRTKKSVKEMTKNRKLSKGKEEALVDLTFNLGDSQLKHTKLIKYVRNKKDNKAVAEFDFTSINKNTTSTALCTRRIDNINSFCDGVHTKESKQAIGKIMQKGVKAYDAIILAAPESRKAYHRNAKRNFIRQINKILNPNKQGSSINK